MFERSELMANLNHDDLLKKQVYIHYGSTRFDPTKNFSVRNIKWFTKPKGGLWASRKNATFGWKDWCAEEDFRECNSANSFEFVIKEGAKVITINTVEQLKKLPQVEDPSNMWYCIDFEKCVELGIDAIELCWYGDEYKDITSGDLYHELYGWDCDSIVIFNPNIVAQLEVRQNET